MAFPEHTNQVIYLISRSEGQYETHLELASSPHASSNIQGLVDEAYRVAAEAMLEYVRNAMPDGAVRSVHATRQYTGEYRTAGDPWPPPLPDEPESGPPMPERPTGGQD